ncbi:MAG: UbiD family decarboxylase [Candidatus Korobacteraceae bacterium]|jgi:4-hydroxy-3-polyprenylbenzoate decarboxylase
MGFKDLREFIDTAASCGDVKQVDGADWDLELGAITEVAASTPSCPLLLFDNIKGYKPGYRVATNLLHTERRLALALGESPELRGVKLLRKWKDAMANANQGPPAKEVQDGPVQENLVKGDDVDILKFPSVRWHELDGGRYMAGSVTIVKDPDSGWVNLGIYRHQIQDERTMSVAMEPGKHGLLIAQKYWDKGLSCPIAVSLGHTPVLFLAATLFAPWGKSEYEVAGFLNGSPIEVLPGPLTGLMIPATSEVVFEGDLLPVDVENREEGPFGEATGYYASPVRREPVMKVQSIIHRNNPIIQGAPPMRPLPGLWHFPLNYRAISLWNDLERCGIPEIRGVWQHGYGMMAISLAQKYAGHAKQAALIAAGSRGANIIRFIVTVDEDIDPYNVYEVMWAIGTRCDPERDIEVIRDGWSAPIDPLVTVDQRSRVDMTTAKVLINACRPIYRRTDFPPTVAVSPELKEKIMAKWGGLFEQ